MNNGNTNEEKAKLLPIVFPAPDRLTPNPALIGVIHYDPTEPADVEEWNESYSDSLK
jgi:hypothetical protein